MTQAPLSRHQRRARASGARRRYDLEGDAAVTIQAAYDAMARGDGAEAARLAHPVSQSHPRSVHPWMILGAVALDQHDGATALAFYTQAERIAPQDPAVLGGLGKAHVLKAEVGPALTRFEQALAAGSRDGSLVRLYLALARRVGWTLRAADAVTPAVDALNAPEFCYLLAETLSDGDEPGRAADWYLRAHRLDPDTPTHQTGRLRALLYKDRFDEVLTGCDTIEQTEDNRNELMVLRLTALRMLGRLDEALSLAESFRFTDIHAYANMRGIVGNIHQDHDDLAKAEAAFLDGTHAVAGAGKVGRSLGVLLFRLGRFDEGEPYYRQRIASSARARVPFDNSAPESLARNKQIFLLGEQGIGDQLALLTLVRAAPIDLSATRLKLIGDARMQAALQGNPLGIEAVAMASLTGTQDEALLGQMVYPGDLIRYRQTADPAVLHQPVLAPAPGAVARIRARYAARAGGRPVIGMAWKSTGNLTGHLRSIPLAELVTLAPRDALIVNLQYGSAEPELAAARAARPDVEIFTDPEIDQMADLAGFFAQIAALDTVVTIDNTTAHASGAMGHPDTHVLIPAGAEAMWYWGTSDTDAGLDPWYGAVRLHRQTTPRDWAPVLESIEAALSTGSRYP